MEGKVATPPLGPQPPGHRTVGDPAIGEVVLRDAIPRPETKDDLDPIPAYDPIYNDLYVESPIGQRINNYPIKMTVDLGDRIHEVNFLVDLTYNPFRAAYSQFYKRISTKGKSPSVFEISARWNEYKDLRDGYLAKHPNEPRPDFILPDVTIAEPIPEPPDVERKATAQQQLDVGKEERRLSHEPRGFFENLSLPGLIDLSGHVADFFAQKVKSEEKAALDIQQAQLEELNRMIIQKEEELRRPEEEEEEEEMQGSEEEQQEEEVVG